MSAAAASLLDLDGAPAAPTATATVHLTLPRDDDEQATFLRTQLARGGNGACRDCGAAAPSWASVNNAVLLCLECAGVHRALGVHVSFVRSLTLDRWKPEQLATLAAGGNARFEDSLGRELAALPPAQLYAHARAAHYRDTLNDEALRSLGRDPVAERAARAAERAKWAAAAAARPSPSAIGSAPPRTPARTPTCCGMFC